MARRLVLAMNRLLGSQRPAAATAGEAIAIAVSGGNALVGDGAGGLSILDLRGCGAAARTGPRPRLYSRPPLPPPP